VKPESTLNFDKGLKGHLFFVRGIRAERPLDLFSNVQDLGLAITGHTTTGFGQKAHFSDPKIKFSETLIFFLSDVFFRRVKRISYESIFWRSYGVRSATFWSICRVWGKISVRGHRNQLHGYIVLQST
jgi:hypothetical protein